MADEHDGDSYERFEPTHFIVCEHILPKPDDSQEDWVRRTTMLADMAEGLASSMFAWLRINAPMLTTYESLPAQLVAGIGFLCRGIRDTGRAQLEKRGVEPLDINSDQARIARDRLADPTCSPQEREFLLDVLAHLLECEGRRTPNPPAEPTEWPEGGFVIGGEE